MKFLNSLRKASNLLTSAAFILVGIIVTVICTLALISDAGSGVTYAKTEGVISSITSERVEDGDGDYHDEYTVKVSYTVNGKEYRDVEYGSYDSFMKEGGKVEILYNVDDPSDIKAPGSNLIPYIVGTAGLAAIAFGIYNFAGQAGTKVDEMNEYDRVDMQSVSAEEIEAVRSCTEEMKQYIFMFQNFRQGHDMKDKDGNLVYAGNVVKTTLFRPFVFEFVNHITGTRITREIGHTVTFSVGSSGVNGFSSTLPIKKEFTIDGKSNWDYLAENGYSFDFALEGVSVCYNVKRYGIPVAYLRTAGTNAMTGKNYAVGKVPVNGIYEVNCRESELDMIFLVCMSIARAVFFAA